MAEECSECASTCLEHCSGDLDRVLAGFYDHKSRLLKLNEATKARKVVVHTDEQRLEDTVINLPACMVLSPDGHNVAISYKGHPLTVWEVEGPELVGRCLRVSDNSTQSNAAHTWGRSPRITLAPTYWQVSRAFIRTDLSLGGTHIMMRLKRLTQERIFSPLVSMLIVLPLGTRMVSSSYSVLQPSVSSTDLPPKTQFWTLASLRILDFSTMFVALSVTSKRSGETFRVSRIKWDGAGVEILGSQSTILRNGHGNVGPFAAFAAQLAGRLYCSEIESGLVEIFEAERGHVAGLRRSKGFMGIERIALISAGRHVALIDLCGRLFVESVPPVDAAGAYLAIEREFEVPIDVSEGAVRQTMFDPHSTRLLIYSSSMASIVFLAVMSIMAKQRLKPVEINHKWINHPSIRSGLSNRIWSLRGPHLELAMPGQDSVVEFSIARS